MKAIVAVDKNWGIGKNNDLLFSIPEDMKFFRKTTLNKVVVMGRKTLESFPNGAPLKNRVNIVLSSSLDKDGCITVKNIEILKEKLKEFNDDDIFVIGGATVYKLLLPYISTALVTKVDADGGATVFFENLDKLSNWKMESESEEIETNGYKIKFIEYKNLETKEL